MRLELLHNKTFNTCATVCRQCVYCTSDHL